MSKTVIANDLQEDQMETTLETGFPNGNHLLQPCDEGPTRSTGDAACIYSIGEVHNMTKQYLTPKEVAAELEVSSATVVRWVKAGTISAKRFSPRIIKIPRIEVERLLNQNQEVQMN